MSVAATVLGAVGAAALLWTYVTYPMLVEFLGKLAPQRLTAATVGEPTVLPRVAVIISAHNEASHIGERLVNLIRQDYSAHRLAIIVGSDGSTDDTVSIARAAAAAAPAASVRIVGYQNNRGKASVLNDLVQLAEADILVFSDANTEFAVDAVSRLVEPFAGSDVGATCGELILRAPGTSGNQDHAYWSGERRLKAAESRMGMLLGANGGAYAIRRELYRPLEPDTICDDFVIAMTVSMSGWRNVYCSNAIAREDTPSDESSEYHRRVRIGIGNYQVLFERPEFLFGGPWRLRFSYFSHKVLRWLTPVWLAAILIGTALNYMKPIWQVAFWLQVCGYFFAWIIYVTRGVLPWPGVIRRGMLFVALNAAFVVAFARYIRSDFRGSWRRAAR